MIDHVALSVSDYQRAKDFYAAALAPLGIRLLMEGPSGAGFGSAFPHFWICAGVGSFQSAEALQPITPVHLSFRAGCREDVQRFHQAALAAGGRDFGAPGVRAQYHPGYYGAFVLDPDGHNIEAVNHNR